MKRFIICFIVLSLVTVSANAQAGSSVAWDRGEREMFMGLTLFVRQGVMDIGYTVNDFLYKNIHGYKVLEPVKLGRGRYQVTVIAGSEYNDLDTNIVFEIVRISETDAFIQTILLRNRQQQVRAATFEEKMFVLMMYFREH